MQTNEVDFSGRLPIEGYGPGYFRIGGAIHEGPIALFPDGALPWPGLHDMSLFFERAEAVDLLVVGTGRDFALLAPGTRAALEAAGLGVEAMATGPACRSFNVLLSEARRVAAALVPL